MIMDQETILKMYREAVENGTGAKQIKSLARLNGVDEGDIKKILKDAGEYIPRQRRRKQKAGILIEAADPVPGEIGYKPQENEHVGNMSAREEASEAAGNDEPQKAAGCQAQENKTKISPVIKECIVRGIEDMELKLKKGKEEISAKIKEMQDLEALYLRAKFEYAGMMLEGKINVDTTGSETGQSSEQAGDNNLL